MDYPGWSSEEPGLERGLDESSGWVAIAALGADEIPQVDGIERQKKSILGQALRIDLWALSDEGVYRIMSAQTCFVTEESPEHGKGVEAGTQSVRTGFLMGLRSRGRRILCLCVQESLLQNPEK